MNFLLSEKFTLSTHLTPQEIYNRLDHFVYKRANFLEGFGNKKPSEKYEGWYDEESFKIKRIINQRNSFPLAIVGSMVQNGFSPVIHGDIVENENLSAIHIKMSPNLFAKIILTYIVIFPILFFFIPDKPKNELFLNILPWVVSVIFITIITIATYYEIRKAKKDLITYFDAELIYS
jgi:hypothetical protein